VSKLAISPLHTSSCHDAYKTIGAIVVSYIKVFTFLGRRREEGKFLKEWLTINLQACHLL
jgi:hypothetical protein